MGSHVPDGRNRRSIRLPGYDYAASGAYFLTLVTQGRACLFGDVVEGEMHTNDAGRMVQEWWAELARKFPNVTPDAQVVMPNHFHGIVIIGATRVGADLRVCPVPGDATASPEAPPPQGAHPGAPLPEMVQWFKTMTTNAYIRGVKTTGWPPFSGRLWQRNYYEHIVRDEESLEHIRAYIASNPAQWIEDEENPDARSQTAFRQEWERYVVCSPLEKRP